MACAGKFALRQLGKGFQGMLSFTPVQGVWFSREFFDLHWDLQPPMCLAGGSIDGGMSGGGAEEEDADYAEAAEAELPH